MADYPPLSRYYIASYAANDRDFPVVAIRLDPRTAGYKVPEDLSPHPDSKRYPNHVFTGAQPSSGDQVVTHVYEILPSPWVPFTRYDDDLGPIQGRRRSVKNEGQVASLAADKKVSYEGREGSAIVSNEIEETWSIAVDEDGNSLFPIKDRDFYDASRGPVQERRQLFVPTGEEEGSLENVNGVITQTSYEPYNEFLSVKIVQTYSVNGPQLVGKATDNDGQLVTVTTQRKGALDYIPPNPTATRTVEASREDAESLVERIVDTPEVFSAKALSVNRPDPVPEKFRITIPSVSEEQTLAGTAQTPILLTGEFAKSEQQVNKFIKRTSKTGRIVGEKQTLRGKQWTSELGGGYAIITEEYPVPENTPIGDVYGVISDQIENLGDGNSLRRKVQLETSNQILLGWGTSEESNISGQFLPALDGQDYDEELDIVIPYKQLAAPAYSKNVTLGPRRRTAPRDAVHSTVQKYDILDVQQSLEEYYWEIPDMISIQLPDRLISARVVTSFSEGSASGSGGGDTYHWSASGSSSRRGSIVWDIEEGFSGNIPTTRCIFFLEKGQSSTNDVLNKVKAKRNNPNIKFWPNARPEAHELVVFGQSSGFSESESVSFNSSSQSNGSDFSFNVDKTTIPATIHPLIIISEGLIGSGVGQNPATALVSPSILEATQPYSRFPTGEFIYQINASPYKFSYTRVDVLLVNITSEYV